MTSTPSITGLTALIASLVAQSAAADSTLHMFPLDGNTGAVGAASDTEDWDSSIAGFTFAQAYVRGGQAFVVLLERQKGQVEIYELNGGNLGPRTSHYFLGRTYSSAKIIVDSGIPYLVLHDEDDGALRRYLLEASGSLGASTSLAGDVWETRATFAAYAVSGTAYYFGHDPWSGETILYREDGTPIADSTWTRGFTEVDHTIIGNRTFQLLYKHNDEPGNQGGRLHLREITAAGTPLLDLYNSTAQGKSWTTVAFFTHAPASPPGIEVVPTHAIFFYNGSTGAYRVRRFNTAGLQAQTATGNLPANLTDISFVRDGDTTYLVAVDEEGTDTLSASQIENMVDFVRASSLSGVPGYQMVLMQNGRVVHQHASGLANIAANTAMTNDTPIDIGSVSKTVMSVTMGRLEEWDEVEVDGHITDYLDYSGLGFSFDPGQIAADNKSITLRDMFYHSSGWNGGSCSIAGITDDLSCTTRLYNAPESGPCAEAGDCSYNYENMNYSVMRHSVELVSNLHDTADIDAFAAQTWMDRLGLGGMSCLARFGGSANYGCPFDSNDVDTSNDAVACLNQPAAWVEFPQADSPGCGGGGWKASSRELAKFMRGIRYRRSIGERMAQEILTPRLNGSNDWVGVGWNSLGWNPDGERALVKVGSVPNRYYASLMHLPDHDVIAVLMANADIGTLSIMKSAWENK